MIGYANNRAKSTRYIIRVKGRLDAHWEGWFEGWTITHTQEGETILSGDMIDQSALHGLFEKIHSLNLTLLSVQKVEADQEEDRSGSPGRTSM